MKNLILIVILVVAGVVIYGKFQKDPDVALSDGLRNRWFSRGSNQTGMVSAVDHFEVDKDLHVKVFLTEDYQNLPGTQMDCMKSIVAIVRNEQVKGPMATIEFIYRGNTIAKTSDASYTIQMIQPGT
ncbi:hypothetical protein LLG95_02770 [bacterium]|nr:hypothetical protein [bacterium]